MADVEPVSGSSSAPRDTPKKLHLDLGASTASLRADLEELPPLAALFQIDFDIKAGYTLSWQRSVDGVDLDGVEFKSLPSGLHNLSEDLVYFVHGSYAGVSAFIRAAASDESRGALMVSVGALVPLSYGRLGRCWRHVEGLKALARKYVEDTSAHEALDDYFNRYKLRSTTLPPGIPDMVSPISQRRSGVTSQFNRPFRNRANSMPAEGQALSPNHPAKSLLTFLDTFGPLVFPLYRAALARKRILLVTHAPVHLPCNFVYSISILANIPLSSSDLLPVEPTRLKPLFSVGVHDIPQLEEAAAARARSAYSERGAWVACTTDEIIAMKTNLYDILVRLPNNPNEYPTITTPENTPIKATQRDLRRYRALRKAIRHRYPSSPAAPDDGCNPDGKPPVESLCHPPAWREIAYASFIWWASAGEQADKTESDDGRLLMDTHFSYTPTFTSGFDDAAASSTEEDDEPEGGRDETRYASISSATSAPSAPRNRRRKPRRRSTGMRGESAGVEMDIIAYFHRMTSKMLQTITGPEAELDGAEEEEEGEDERLLGRQESEEESYWVSLGDVVEMGLDRYSDADREFVVEMARRWGRREVQVERAGLGCCGVQCG